MHITLHAFTCILHYMHITLHYITHIYMHITLHYIICILHYMHATLHYMHITLHAYNITCILHYMHITLHAYYRICPNIRALCECGPLGALLLISKKNILHVIKSILKLNRSCFALFEHLKVLKSNS